MEAFAPRGSSPDRTRPLFHMRAVEMPFLSRQAGRPIFEDREFVEIIIPGINRSTAIEPVNEQHIARWPDAYAAFKRGQDLPQSGTPLEEWPPLTKATVANLRALNMRTVEDLAAAPDAVLQNIGAGGHDFRRRAQAFLDRSAGGAPLEAALQRIEALELQKVVLESQVRDLAAIIENAGTEEAGGATPAPHGPGRPRKAA